VKLPQGITLDDMQNKWATAIEPTLNAVTSKPILLKSVSLKSGSNSVNHTLGKQLVGWFIVRQRAAASIYDNQDSNQHQTLTLILVSSASAVVDLLVF
jgi:hypothetical protein